MKRVRLLLLHTGVLAAVLLWGLIAPGHLYAQFSEVTEARTVTGGQPTNFFISWQSERTIDGFYVQVPHGWQLNQVRISEAMGGSSLETSIQARETSQSPTYRVAVNSGLRGSYHNVFQVQVGDEIGNFSWAITPYVEREEADSLLTNARYSGSLEVKPALRVADQYAVTFDPRIAERPALMNDDDPVSLSLEDSFTTEFWLKTVYLNEVVVSTWDGRERSAYPVEVMIGPGGYLHCYRGVGGMHHSLTSSRPLADGSWHHVAVTHEDAEGWMRLIVDGQTVDSLHLDNELAVDQSSTFVLGGRPTSSYTSEDVDPRSFNYSGELDELRLWSLPREEKEIRSNMHRQIESQREGLHRVGFDEQDVGSLFSGSTSSMQFVLSELSLFDPIEQLRADRRSNGVEVTWEAIPSYSEEFVVERSTDGQYFETVSRVHAGTSDESDTRQSRRYSLTDPTVHEGVVYYRVRQVVNEEDRQSMAKTIKVGLRSPRRNVVDLVGNFPNPFNATTLIKYELYETQDVRLDVWDMSGHRRASLVDKTQEPGQYDVRFDAANLPSGAYVIRLETEQSTQTHTMILMK